MFDVALCAGGDPLWEAAFRRVLPGARLHLWPACPDSVDFAIVSKPPPALFTHLRVCRAIFTLGAGVDALLAIPTLPRDIPIIRLEDAGMAIQMSEYVTLAVLRAYRETDHYARAQREQRWARNARLNKSDFGVGFLGVGVLAQAVASTLRVFEFPMFGWSRSGKKVEGIATFAGEAGLHAMLARSRVLVVLLPATPQTRGLVNGAKLSLLPTGAHVVNVGRGAVIVESDLLAMLDEGHLASATLDVFDSEPLPADHRFWKHPKVTLTPHIAAMTMLHEAADQVAQKMLAMLRNVPIGGVVDGNRGY